MRYLLVMLLAATLFVTACTKPVDNEEIEEVNEQIPEEQVEEVEEDATEEEPTKEESNNDEIKDEKQNSENNKDKDTNNEQSKEEDKERTDTEKRDEKTDNNKGELLADHEAIAIVRNHLELQFDQDVKIVVDHEENGRFLIHVYDAIPGNNGVGHTATRGWYYVDRKTGEVESMF
ncbi:hypothetical protein BTR23_03655 [Alkalihalophilus pseudofirmus]|nr:hypothetical protein BTR23_03655 [Alkalihalophilus pseudofirmus]